MKISSVQQLEMSFGETPRTSRATFLYSEQNRDNADLPPIEFQPPERTEASRLAGRVNAASTSSYELNALLQERHILLDKKFAQTITKKELNRLELVRWAIDRIEDAKFGFELDQLESATERYEELLTKLKDLGEQIERRAGESSEQKKNRAYGRND